MQIVIDPESSVPPYEQLRIAVATQVNEGTLAAGAKLPTVRALAAELGLAANTVAKAYRALESDGVIETRGRAGTFVASNALAAPPADVSRLAGDLAAAARRRGLSLDETQRLVERAWRHS